jgi:hypothetical protein
LNYRLLPFRLSIKTNNIDVAMHTLLVTRGATIKEAHTLGLHTRQVTMWSFRTDEYTHGWLECGASKLMSTHTAG